MYKAMHQSIRDSEKLANLSDFAFRVWEMGCVASDLTGRITGSPKKFWAQAMPLCPYDERKYARAIDEIRDAGLVHRYDVDGKTFMVFHDHDDHNKGTKNLRNLRPSCPPPPTRLCYCIVYTKKEESIPTADASADGTADGSTGVHVPVLVPVPVLEKRGVVGERRAATALALLWNDGPGEHLNAKSATDKVQAAMDVGVDPQLIEQHFWDHQAIKGLKIWEVLDPLRPIQSAPGVKSISQVLAEFKGGKP